MSDSLSRRRWLLDMGCGFGWLAVSSLLQREIARAGAAPPSAARAKRIIQIFCVGGMSHLDTFDFKPELQRRNGQPYSMPTFFGQGGNLWACPWSFDQRGASGLWISELLPHLAAQADRLTVIRSMVAKSANHMPAIAQMNTGFVLTGFPAMGAWVNYGLGSENENLPAFVVLPDPQGYPAGGSVQWTNGFLPASVQGTAFRTRDSGPLVPDLAPPEPVAAPTRSAALDWLRTMNRKFAAQRPGGPGLAARIRSYEVAARMQLSVPEVSDLDRESAATRRLYGLDQEETASLARRCVLARRLVERGVRFVQVYQGGSGRTWDAHGDLIENHASMAREYDRPVAALIQDLASRGLLDDTLVMGITEFGRTPVSQGIGKAAGRDHHPRCFTCWLAGGGLKPGFGYGASDELGCEAVENPVTVYDLHATALRLLGLDHETLTFYHNGIERRLTDVHGRVIEALFS